MCFDCVCYDPVIFVKLVNPVSKPKITGCTYRKLTLAKLDHTEITSKYHVIIA